MKELSRINKIILPFMILILLFLIQGCVTTQTVPGSDLPKYSKHPCEIYTSDTTYWLGNPTIQGDFLIGSITNRGDKYDLDYNKVYIISDSLITYDPGKTMVFIPLDAILEAKVKVTRYDYPLAALGIIGLSTLLVLVITLLRMSSI